ncbi:peptidylprolyl isomerase [Prevotella sp. oral taxon 376]|uniref:FKBP-type peptidyl-prolyl cis-trans isomerase n=1 Tax=Prevotella sp. oral taxon 376 TaxID=712466 RepID=UPI000D1E0C4E|nr:FKBP-type peptidyl-prolyl cis-trans isomerase [Prevotella sp. oral taxon 376]PTL33433.1 peptidylprolyl isomerase [Prevotella sp. oral taxon 376]
MKHLFYPLLMLAGLLSLAACSETDTSQEEFADWQQKNETYFKNLYQTAQGNTAKYKIFKNWSFTADKATKPEDHIVVEVLKSGTGSGCPLYTDSVAVHYEGRLIPSATYSGGYTFNKTWAGDYNLQTMKTVTLSPSKSVDGFTTAVMNMHIGDRWKVYIPYQLGYGTSTPSNSTIPAYSTLIFDITLVAYSRAGTHIPTIQAKPSFVWIDE